MVTTKLQGGLGNQLFQMAAALAYSIRHDIFCSFSTEITSPHYPNQPVYQFPGIDYSSPAAIAIKNLPVYEEPFFHYHEIPAMKNICLQGYFQSEKYFKEYRKEILRAFGFAYEKIPDMVGIHVRRGDYLTKPGVHPVVTTEYLKKAIDYFYSEKKKYSFTVFTDDAGWCNENIPQLNTNCQFAIIYPQAHPEVYCLYWLSCCEHIIGSNSSFSWWAHYLNQNPDKIGIFPSQWFGPEGPTDTKDVYPENCIKL